MKLLIVTIAFTCSLGIAPPAAANTQTDEFFDLSLEELSNVTINSVALRQQSPRDSAALVTVITREMLDDYAVASLAQALNLLPGYRILQRTTFNQTYSGVRGFSVNDNDKHILLLIDGVPVRVNSTGGSNRLLYESFPVAALERIELLQGQAATLYGSNAVAAVINLVTRPVNSVRAEWRDGALNGGIGQSFAVGEGSLDIIVQRQRAYSDWNHQQVAIPAQLTGGLRSRGDSIFARWQQAGWHGQLLLLDNKSTTISTLFSTAPNSEANDQTVLARFGSETVLTESAGLIWKWDLAYDSTDIGYSTVQGDSTELWLNSSLRGDLSERLHWLLGASAMQADGTLPPLLGDWSTREQSAFLQLNYDLTERLELGAGVNWQHLKNADEDVTPQSSLVWKVDDAWRVKLLYGESFRNADPRERFSNNRTQRGNPDLIAERGVQSTIALSYQDQGLQFQLALFEQNIREVISLLRLPDQSRLFSNVGKASATGLQLEFHWQLATDWMLDGTHVHLLTNQGLTEPEQLSSLGLRFLAPSHWSASLLLDYASASRYLIEPIGAYYNPKPQASLSLNTAFRLKLDSWCQVCPRGTELQLSGVNLGKAQHWQVATVTVNTLPLLPDRHWALGFSMPVSF